MHDTLTSNAKSFKSNTSSQVSIYVQLFSSLLKVANNIKYFVFKQFDLCTYK
jgi:hypothetical protein